MALNITPTRNEDITLSGDATGSGATAITVAIVDDSHNHIISNVDGLQSALDATGGGVTNITYANLVTAIGASTLTAGSFYRITDFATHHYIVDGNGTRYSGAGNEITGTTEPLMVLATSTSTISREAKSALYPQDIIHYDWDPDNWMNDLSFADAESGPATAIITGFTGVITFRHDTLQDNYCGYDFRNVRFRRWKTDAVAWASTTTYAKGDYCTDSSRIYYSTANTNLNNDVSTSYWLEIIDLSYTEYWFTTPQGASDSSDLLTFHECNASSLYEDSAFENHIEGCKLAKSPLLGNNVFHLEIDDNWLTCGNTIDTFCQWNTIGASFYKNTVEAGFSRNTTGASFYGNTIGSSVSYNTIGENFNYNTIRTRFNGNTIGASFKYNTTESNFSENTIGTSFNSNTIGESFKYNTTAWNFSCNTTESNFSENTIGVSFNSNTIGADFNGNTIGDYFNYNTIGSNVNYNTIGESFSYNTTGTSFNGNEIGANFKYNTTAWNFSYNTIGTSFNSNTIGAEFSNNTIGDYFKYNTIEPGLKDIVGAGIDFTSATHVYASYNCTLYVRPDGTAKLRYYNDSDALTVVAANA